MTRKAIITGREGRMTPKAFLNHFRDRREGQNITKGRDE